MYFFGKIIGVFLGFKWGGFFGAIAGLILGSIADKKLYELGSVNSSFFKKKTTRQALFMQTTFAVLGHLSKSKGRVTEEDIQLANQLMNQMQLDESHRKLAQEAFRRGKEADFPLRQVIREFRIGCGQRADLLRMFLHVQVQAAFADSQLHESEKEVLYVVAEELGLSRMQFEQMPWKLPLVNLPKVDSIANTNKAVINSKVATNTNNKADTNNLQAQH